MKNYEYSLMAPGPVNIHPEVRKILSEPMIHHRTPEFDEILASALEKIKLVFKTVQPVYLLTATGSGGMECLLVNTLSPSDAVLCVVSGKFGERWAQMAKTFGAQVDEIHVPWGQAVSPLAVAEKLKEKKYAAVLTQACETSTGILHSIEELGKIVHAHPETLLLVDGITALGALPLPMDLWHIDGLVGGSQKAFMLPTGMSFVSFSEKAQHKFDTAKMPRFYFDIRKKKKANLQGQTFFSSNVSLIKALNFVLKQIEQQGLENLFAENKRRSDFTAEILKLLDLKSYAQVKSPSLTAILMPDSVDGQKVRSDIEKNFNLTLMGGQDQEKGKIIRVGHMGYILDSELLQLADALFQTLKQHHCQFNMDHETYMKH
ncbi:MAG: alanine--glyoxylate aminotransferase family protein, partial [Bdellovibrionales bacterium]|nr:alanine--glyoxylate aminotransferase family protein [Bdellovibrionales bacterium]